MANSISSVTTGTGGIVLMSVDTSGNTNIKSGTTTIAAISSTGVAVTGTLSASGGVAKASLPTGSVLQVVQGTTTAGVSNGTTTFVDTTLTATITPISATSKILIMASHAGVSRTSGNINNSGMIKLLRASTDLGIFSYAIGYTATALTQYANCSFSYLDSPATTSATIYKTQFANDLAAAGISVGNGGISTIILMEIAA